MFLKKNRSLFIPHGGGPLPLLDDPEHLEMNRCLKNIASRIPKPKAIILVSAHWEENIVTITGGDKLELIYDYYGFPEETYDISYPASGNPKLAKNIQSILLKNNIPAKIDKSRGFDHGMFVPLKLMYPDADIPCVQLSLVNSLDSEQHIKIGKALSQLDDDGLLIIGSGFTFHNLRYMGLNAQSKTDKGNEEFERWLIETCAGANLDAQEREHRLLNWKGAPYATYCQPREEHLLPLHVCFGFGQKQAELVLNCLVIGKKTSGYLW